MPLSQDDRISFSKKMVEGPFLIAAINKSKTSIVAEKAKVEKLDLAHKNLVDGRTAPINGYQAELILLDGITRSTLTEQDQQDAANLVLGNHLYPNNVTNPPPSTAPSVWTKTKPYARNKAVGKFYNEAYGATVTKESDLIAAVQTSISSIQSTYATIEQVTGQHCTTPGGTCSLPSFTTQSTCTTGGGVWTPGTDTIATYPDMVTALNNLISSVNTLKTFLISEASSVYTSDYDSTRKTQSQAAIDNINNVIIPAINTWLAYSDFNTAHGQTTCVGFYSYNPTLLGATKLQTSQITALLSALTARLTFASSRQSQLTSYLGSITQDLSTGDVTGDGLYFERWSFIQLRLNMLGGSLFALKGYERAQGAQDDQIANINAANATYSLILKTTAFAAPASGTEFLNVKSTAGFSVGDNVFVIADGQPELVRSIKAIDGNRVTLGQPVPANYRDSSFGRMYKDLT